MALKVRKACELCRGGTGGNVTCPCPKDWLVDNSDMACDDSCLKEGVEVEVKVMVLPRAAIAPAS